MAVKNYYEDEQNNSKSTNVLSSYGITGKAQTANSNNFQTLLNEYSKGAYGNLSSAANNALASYQRAENQALSTKNEAYKASEQAKLYNENYLKQQGLNGTGANVTSNMGVSSAYMNAIKDADAVKANSQEQALQGFNNYVRDYNDSVNNSNYNNAITELESASTPQELQNILAKYQNNVSDQQYFQMQNAVNQKVNEANLANALAQRGVSNLSSAVNAKTSNPSQFLGENVKTSDNKFKWADAILTAARNGTIPDNAAFQIGDSYWIYNNGNFYKSDYKYDNNDAVGYSGSPSKEYKDALKKQYGITLNF